MNFLKFFSLLPLIQAIPVEPLTAQSSTSGEAIPRLAVYVQTFHDENNNGRSVDLLSLSLPDIRTTHVILAALHVMAQPGDIHLNDNPVDNAMYDELWAQAATLQAKGVKVSCMMGGAASGTWNYFAGDDIKFHKYYDPLLNNVIKKHNLNGIDLDFEQYVDITVIERLVKQLYYDMGPGFIITISLVASALSHGVSNIGFPYINLEARARASNGKPMISFYNAQFTNGWGDAWNTDDYVSIIKAGWDPARVVMVVPTSKHDAQGWVQMGTLQGTIRDLKEKYPNFGGVNGWEYFDAGSSDGMPKPYMWMANVRQALEWHN